MGRVQLAINVGDIEESIAFYTKLLGVAPAKIRPGYANFAVADPPLKLVLIEGGQPGSLNHLGIEVENTEVVASQTARLAAEGFSTRIEENVDCCYAVQDKVWVTDPNGAPWEIYTVLADSPRKLDAAESHESSDSKNQKLAAKSVASVGGCCGEGSCC